MPENTKPTDAERMQIALKFYLERATWTSLDAERAEFQRLFDAQDATLCTIAYHGEAHDNAAERIRLMKDWGLEIVLNDGTVESATIVSVEVDDEDGQYKAVCARWADEAPHPDPNDTFTVDIYDDVQRFEVC